MDLDPRLQGHGEHASPGFNTSTPSSTTSGRVPTNQYGSQYLGAARDATSESPQQYHSTGNHAGDDADAADAADAKKSRACEACRGLKVRCEPDPNDGPCKRCKKAGRNCVVTMPTRKRQKKTDSRVSELEKKIDALTASLQSRVGQQAGAAAAASAGGVGGSGAGSSSPNNQRGSDWSGGETSGWNNQNTSSDRESPYQQQSHQQQHHHTNSHKRKAPQDHDSAAADDGRSSTAPTTSGWPAYNSKTAEGDIVDRGLVPMELASDLFLRYNTQMTRHLPGVVFPTSMTVAELRRTKPILFHAIMAAAAGENHSLQRVLQKELMLIFAEKVVVTGEKSLELVQALNVAVIWYWPPEYFEELKFYQLIHMAAVMAIDIGLGRRTSHRGSSVPLGWREHPGRRPPPPDPTTLESRRTWLTCYYLACNTSMSLHRPNLIRWTAFMAESKDLLETSPNAAPTDKYFCHLVWSHHLGEEVGAQFSMDDPSSLVNITDARTQYSLRVLERDLDRYVASVPKDQMQPTLKIGFNVLNLYMHEMALHSDPINPPVRPPFDAEALKDGLLSSDALSAAHINALSACLTAIEGIFETFLSMDVANIRCLPVFNFVRVAYAVVVLMKMYFSASNSSSELGNVINRDNMRVQHYLDQLLEKFRVTATDDKCRPASKFLVVLAMLRSWFVKQGKNDKSQKEEETPRSKPSIQQLPNAMSTTISQQQPLHPTSQSQYLAPATANTPLQLLSEVATGQDQQSRSGGTGWGYPGGGSRATSQSLFQDSMASPASNTPPLMGTTQLSGNGNDEQQNQAASGFPPWITQSMLSDINFNSMIQAGMDVPGLDGLDGRGFNLGTDSWYTDMFQGLPDPNMFPF